MGSADSTHRSSWSDGAKAQRGSTAPGRSEGTEQEDGIRKRRRSDRPGAVGREVSYRCAHCKTSGVMSEVCCKISPEVI